LLAAPRFFANAGQVIFYRAPGRCKQRPSSGLRPVPSLSIGRTTPHGSPDEKPVFSLGQMADISSSSHHSISPPLHQKAYVPLKLPKVSTPRCFRNSGLRVMIEKPSRKRSPKNSSVPTIKSATTISLTTLLLFWNVLPSRSIFRATARPSVPRKKHQPNPTLRGPRQSRRFPNIPVNSSLHASQRLSRVPIEWVAGARSCFFHAGKGHDWHLCASSEPPGRIEMKKRSRSGGDSTYRFYGNYGCAPKI
jgi:hypothetical protein